MTENIALNFVIEGEDFAFRAWPRVPRMGEHVSLHDPRLKAKRLAKVILVVWGVREETALGRQLECDIHVLWDEPTIPIQEQLT